jgi:CheY-like chemotaxis protein
MCNSGIPVDVVFTDIGLNGSSSGWAVAEAFRARRADIPVVYASGNAADRSRRVAGSLFFNKPYQPAEILRACETLCPSKR